MLRAILFILLSSVVLMAQAKSRNDEFNKLADDFVKESLALSPSNASQAGYHKHFDPKTGKTIELDAVLDDVSPAAMAAQVAFYKSWRDRFHRETPASALDPQNAADWQLIDDNIGLSLLELEQIQNYRHNPTVYVELVGGALFLPLTQEYASKEVRVGHVLSRISQIPRFIAQAKQDLVDADPIFIKVAREENDGNIDLIKTTVAQAITAGSPLKSQYDRVAPVAIAALNDFSAWLDNDLAKSLTNLHRTWRLGKHWYDLKFRLVMETPVTPEQVLADAEQQLAETRQKMLDLALPLHKQMFSDHPDHTELQGRERENKIIGEVLSKIADDHCDRNRLIECVNADLDGVKKFIREKKIVSLSPRENLKVIPTPPFMRGIFSVGGFHSAPPLEPTAEAEYWVTPIDPKTPEARAESKLREYNRYVLQWLTIHEALPGHYIQFEHVNSIQPVTRRLVRSLFGNGPNVEGWAEYMAQNMLYEGYDDRDPKYQLSYWKVWLRAVANTILDVRLQTMNMSDEEAMDLMLKDCFQTQAEAEGKLQRAKLSSTQLPTYFVGTREWWSFRNNYQKAAGPKFDMLKFHDMVLAQGPLPVPVIEKLVMPSAGK
jgi:uncharacterized protein (DUF885 family)